MKTLDFEQPYDDMFNADKGNPESEEVSAWELINNYYGFDGTVERRNEVERIAKGQGIDFDEDTPDQYRPERE